MSFHGGKGEPHDRVLPGMRSQQKERRWRCYQQWWTEGTRPQGKPKHGIQVRGEDMSGESDNAEVGNGFGAGRFGTMEKAPGGERVEAHIYLST